MASTPDGPRYVTGIQDEKEKCCYKDFYETETLYEAKEKADEKSDKVNRSAIVFDRKLMEIVHRKVVQTVVGVPKKPELPHRGKKKKVKPEVKPEVKPSDDDYF